MQEDNDRTEFKTALLEKGWQEKENIFSLPLDSNINLWIHPYSGKILFSPQLVDLLKMLTPVLQLMTSEA